MVALNIIVYNEAHRIVDTLEKAGQYCDEIVLVDQHSTDGTFDLALPLVTTAVQDHHHGFPEPSRPVAEWFTRSDTILLLDADEHLSPEAISWLGDLDNVSGAYFHRTTYLDGEHWITDLRPHFRYWKKGFAQHPTRIHTESFPMVKRDCVTSPADAIVHMKTSEEQALDDANYAQIIERGLGPYPVGTWISQ